MVLTLAACSGGNQTRELQGRLATGSTQQQLVVIETAGSATPQQFVGAADANGRFVVNAPVGVPVRLLVANATATGFTVTGHLNPARFTINSPGARIDLGNVRPTGVTLVEDPGTTGTTTTTTTTPEHMCPGTTTTTTTTGDARLPYDVRPALGSTFKLDDAFLAEGPLPASIVSVTMDNGTWRLTELQNDTAFVITQADCDHVGNRDVGRDRVFITWTNADGSTQTDHLDLRYCDGSGGSSGGLDDDHGGSSDGDSDHDGSTCHPSDDDECGGVEVEGCGGTELECDHHDELEPAEGSSDDDACAPGTGTDGGVVDTGSADAGLN
ncbi:MAG: hypothetical protein QM723_22285 [Myxococcaceae bacterium]